MEPISKEDRDYTVIEWGEEQTIKNCKIILRGGEYTIHKIKLDNGANVYLVPELFYKTAKERLGKLSNKS